MWKDAMWLGLPADEIEKRKIRHGDLTGRFTYFRHTFLLTEPGSLVLDITANSRYRLWVNGNPVTSGPCKGDLHRHYYETVDATEHLCVGQNVIAVQVLYMDHYAAIKQGDERAAIFSVCTPDGGHRLAVEGNVLNAKGNFLLPVTTGKANWKAFLDASYHLKSQQITDCMGAVCEEVDFAKTPHGWKYSEFDDSSWGIPQPLESVVIDDFMHAVGLLQRFPVQERPIPLMYERKQEFSREVRSDTQILHAGKSVIPAGTSRRIILDSDVEVSGYPVFRFSGGKGSRVRITYFEKFIGGRSKLDAENGEISGITDTLLLDGTEITFEPFWYRTFRFIALEITAEAETTVYKPTYQKTGYPLQVESWVSSSEKWVEEVWELCVRTLENCMMETYMDCPYYEQNQFPMDTRLQALFCAAVSNDTRLTMKALEDFHCSITPDGLVHGRYPATYQQIISTFSMHYIYMLEEIYHHTGDIAPLRRYLPDMDRILQYYHDRIGEDGLVGRLGYWEFVDWQDAWTHLGGVPEALLHGPSTIINLMYALALERAAVLWGAAGRHGLAQEYRVRRERILLQVWRLCWDEDRKLYREGPSFCQYTQHAQSWAVLNGGMEGDQARTVLRHAMEDEDVLRVSFSTSFEWFRALEIAGLYDETKADMERWAALPAAGNTTCPETPENSRSECHAWSALPIYEFIRTMAGIQVQNQVLEIRPNLSYLPDLEGQVVTPVGRVDFAYHKQENRDYCEITIPAGTEAVFVYPDGRRKVLSSGMTHALIC